ncbi:hypothetical protein [Catelliglobosispora koreensis]|uniref:hypothetical protein n=1 Tax=Catelliglobosispora koreensis TaxID=129052 RepID=UPI0003609A6B|nr:hypothetical protein [Catelliglobosispora koreensis]
MNTTAYNDQMHAACSEAAAQMTAMAAIEPDAEISTVATPVGSWLRDQRAGVIACWEADTATTCQHVTGAPQVLFGAAWKPGHLVCNSCIIQLKTLNPLEEKTCDQCGNVTEDVDTHLTIIGPILYAYGQCAACRANEIPLHA